MVDSSLDVIIDSFEKIERVRGRNKKLEILAGLSSPPSVNELAREILTYLLNPYWHYGIRLDNSEYTRTFNVRGVYTGVDDDSEKYWPAFRELLNAMKAKVLTGQSACEDAKVVLGSMSNRYAWFLCNLLNRDIKCGMNILKYDPHIEITANTVFVAMPEIVSINVLRLGEQGSIVIELFGVDYSVHSVSVNESGLSVV